MAKSRGGAGRQRFMQELPGEIREKLLPGAARAGGNVIAEDAKDRLGDKRAETGGGSKVLIADAVKVRVRRKGSAVRARILLEGPGAYVGPWLEWGTDPHFISVDDRDRQGMSIGRFNKKAKDGSLVIGGHFVGPSVHHPGAKPHPFLRPALDHSESAAVAAAQAFIDARVSRNGITGTAEPEGGDA